MITSYCLSVICFSKSNNQSKRETTPHNHSSRVPLLKLYSLRQKRPVISEERPLTICHQYPFAESFIRFAEILHIHNTAGILSAKITDGLDFNERVRGFQFSAICKRRPNADGSFLLTVFVRLRQTLVGVNRYPIYYRLIAANISI